MLLVTPQTLALRMGLQSVATTQANELLEASIKASQIRMESEYGSSFSYQDNYDTFFLDADSFSSAVQGGAYRLRLSNAFVDFKTLRVGVSSTWNSNDMEEIDKSLFRLDGERGILLVDNSLKDRYISVVYFSGFQDDYVVPAWLEEAILAFAPLVFDIAQITNRTPELTKSYEKSSEHALAIITKHRRNTGMLFRPLGV